MLFPGFLYLCLRRSVLKKNNIPNNKGPCEMGNFYDEHKIVHETNTQASATSMNQ